MQPPQDPSNPQPYSQPPFAPQGAYALPPQTPRGTVSMEVISEAWSFLSANIGPWILAMVAYFGVSYGINIVRTIFQALGQNGGSQIWTILSLLLQVVSWVATQLLLGALAKLAIQTVRTRVANINEMWTVKDVGVALVLSGLLQGILYLIACLPGLIVMGVSVFVPLFKSGVFATMVTPGAKPSFPPGLIGTMFGGIALSFLLLLLGTIPLASTLFLVPSLIVDRKIGPWEAITQSFGALKKHFWGSALLLFVLGLINMAGLAVCCVGIMFSLPLTQIAIALVYRDLFGVGESAPQQQTIYAPPPIANPNF